MSPTATPAHSAPPVDHPVLDMHTHPVVPDVWLPAITAYVARANPAALAEPDRLGQARAMYARLAEQGVDHAVVLAEEAPVTTGMVTSEWVLEFTSGVEELHAFVCLNPLLDGDLVARLERLRTQGRVEGIKLLPSYQQFAPNDARLYPLYARAQELGLPVTFHTGTSRFPGTRLKYADPLLLDDVAVDFPRLPILLAHCGRSAWFDTAAMLATLHENVYLEISGLPARNLSRYFSDVHRLARKMIFGSDYPGLPSIRENIRAIVELLGPESARLVLWENGARLLGLKPDC